MLVEILPSLLENLPYGTSPGFIPVSDHDEVLSREARMKRKQHIIIRSVREAGCLELQLYALDRVCRPQRSLYVDSSQRTGNTTRRYRRELDFACNFSFLAWFPALLVFLGVSFESSMSTLMVHIVGYQTNNKNDCVAGLSLIHI